MVTLIAIEWKIIIINLNLQSISKIAQFFWEKEKIKYILFNSIYFVLAGVACLKNQQMESVGGHKDLAVA